MFKEKSLEKVSTENESINNPWISIRENLTNQRYFEALDQCLHLTKTNAQSYLINGNLDVERINESIASIDRAYYKNNELFGENSNELVIKYSQNIPFHQHHFEALRFIRAIFQILCNQGRQAQTYDNFIKLMDIANKNQEGKIIYYMIIEEIILHGLNYIVFADVLNIKTREFLGFHEKIPANNIDEKKTSIKRNEKLFLFYMMFLYSKRNYYLVQKQDINEEDRDFYFKNESNIKNFKDEFLMSNWNYGVENLKEKLIFLEIMAMSACPKDIKIDDLDLNPLKNEALEGNYILAAILSKKFLISYKERGFF